MRSPEDAARLERQEGVAYVEPNWIRRAGARSADVLFGRLWGLENTAQDFAGTTGTTDADVDATDAWDITTGSADVTMAIVDTGIDLDHTDLAANIWANPGESGAGREANGLDDDGNGYVDDAKGYDWVGADGVPDDLNGHGTHVAGTAGAPGANGRGVAGVAWNARLMALRVLDAQGFGDTADIISAYAYAARAGADVVNLSLGGGGLSNPEIAAIRAAPDVLFVTAAGNDGTDNDEAPEYPCAYDEPNVLCVGASDQEDGLAGFSNYGAETVDLAAPGVNVVSTWPGNQYVIFDGSSMAAPHVSGAAALVLASRPAVGIVGLRAALLEGVDARPELSGATVTGGRLNARGALERAGAQPPPAPPTPAPAPSATAPLAVEPEPPAPFSSGDSSPPRLALRVPARPALARALRRGLRVAITCSEGCVTSDARLTIDARTAKRVGLGSRTPTVATARAGRRSAAGTLTLAFRFGAGARRRLAPARSVTLRLAVTATDPAGNRATLARRVVLRR